MLRPVLFWLSESCRSVGLDRVGGPVGEARRITLDALHDFVNGSLQLRILAGNNAGRVIVHLDIGLDTHALDDPLAVDIQKSELGHAYRPAINQRTMVGNSGHPAPGLDRKSTRLNSSHVAISYAVFCLKKNMS